MFPILDQPYEEVKFVAVTRKHRISSDQVTRTDILVLFRFFLLCCFQHNLLGQYLHSSLYTKSVPSPAQQLPEFLKQFKCNLVVLCQKIFLFCFQQHYWRIWCIIFSVYNSLSFELSDHVGSKRWFWRRLKFYLLWKAACTIRSVRSVSHDFSFTEF